MLARRGRFNIKPNVAKGSKAPVTQTTNAPSSESSDKVDKCDAKPLLEPTGAGEIVPVQGAPTSNDVPANTTPVSPPEAMSTSNNVAGGSRAQETSSSELIAGFTSVCLSPVHGVPLDRRHRNMSPPHRQLSMTSPERRKKPRRKFEENEKLDTKKMLMMDMIFWNPKEEKALTRKNAEDVASITDPVARPVAAVVSKVAAPQVKIGDDGNLILDESSLFVEETRNDTSVWDIVDDDRLSKKITSLSFRNRLWRKGTTWTDKETELFYEILRCTGPDFGLMHEFFPSRARNELKCKFNREERQNWQKISDVMSKPSMLDESLYERAAKMESEIEEEANRKKTEAESKKKRKPASEKDHSSKKEKATIDWDESKADLEKEAHDIIVELERQAAKDRSMESGSSSSDSDSDASEVPPLKRSKKKRISKAAMNIIKIAEAKTKTRRQAAEKLRAASSSLAGYDDAASKPDESERVATPTSLAGYDDGPSTSTAQPQNTSYEKQQSKPVLIPKRPVPSIRPVGRLRGRGRGFGAVNMQQSERKKADVVTEETNEVTPSEKPNEVEKTTAEIMGPSGDNGKGNLPEQKSNLSEAEAGETSSATPMSTSESEVFITMEDPQPNLNNEEPVSVPKRPVSSIRPVGRLRGRGRGFGAVNMQQSQRKKTDVVTEETNEVTPSKKPNEVEKTTAEIMGPSGDNGRGNLPEQKSNLGNAEAGSSATPMSTSESEVFTTMEDPNLNNEEPVSVPKPPVPSIRPIGRLRGRGRGFGAVNMQQSQRKKADVVTEETNEVTPSEKPHEVEKTTAEIMGPSGDNGKGNLPEQKSNLCDSEAGEINSAPPSSESEVFVTIEDPQSNLNKKEDTTEHVSPKSGNNEAPEGTSAHPTSSTSQVRKENEKGDKPSVKIEASAAKLTRSRAAPKLPPASRAIKRKAEEPMSAVVVPGPSSVTSPESTAASSSANTRNARKKPAIRADSETDTPSKDEKKPDISSDRAEDLSSGDEEVTFLGQSNPVLKALMERVMKSQKKNDDDDGDEAGPSNSGDAKDTVDKPVLKKLAAGRGRGRGRGRGGR